MTEYLLCADISKRQLCCVEGTVLLPYYKILLIMLHQPRVSIDVAQRNFNEKRGKIKKFSFPPSVPSGVANAVSHRTGKSLYNTSSKTEILS